LNNLDEILKQQMENFAPDAPNVWAGIEQGVQANAASQAGVAGSKAVFSKLVLSVVKVAAIIAIPASVATYFYSKNSEAEKMVETVKSPVINEQIITNEPTVTEETPIEKPQPSKNNSINKKNNSIPNVKKAQEAVIVNNPNVAKETEVEKEHENLNQTINEKVVVAPNNNAVETNPIQVEEDLDEKMEAIENKENNTEATEPNKNVAPSIKIANVLTPNNDGFNDRYVVEIEGEKLFNLKIYNFNNELVFESNDKNNTWDGVSQKTGQACNSGVYYGVLNYKFANSDKPQTTMTKIKLIR